ncbi:MAG: hypothetical protein Q9168_005483 [Polycauliona sp. 1 TL-2023]
MLPKEESLQGETSLMLAASQGHQDVVAWLISNGAEIYTISGDGKTALDEAVDAGFLHIVGLLLSRMSEQERRGCYLQIANRQFRGSRKGTPTGRTVPDHLSGQGPQSDTTEHSLFQVAVVQGDKAAVRMFLNQGADMGDYLPNGEKPLMLAASSSQYDIIDLLLEHGVDVNSASSNGWTTLMHAVRNGNQAVVQQLLTPEATYRGHRDITALLLEQGADTESRSAHDFTPLMHAAYRGDEEAARLLLDSGANMDVSSNHDETAILLAAAGGYTSIVRILLAAGAMPEPAWAGGPNDHSEEGKQQAKQKAVGEPEDRAHARGWTPLMLASQGGYHEIARILLGRGVNTEVKSPHDKTAVEIALENGWIAMEPILRRSS